MKIFDFNKDAYIEMNGIKYLCWLDWCKKHDTNSIMKCIVYWACSRSKGIPEILQSYCLTIEEIEYLSSLSYNNKVPCHYNPKSNYNGSKDRLCYEKTILEIKQYLQKIFFEQRINDLHKMFN